MRFRKTEINMQMRVMHRLWWSKVMTTREMAAMWGIFQTRVCYYLGMYHVVIRAEGGLAHTCAPREHAPRFHRAGAVLS